MNKIEKVSCICIKSKDYKAQWNKVNQILSSRWSTDKDRAQALIDRMEDARKFYVAISRAKKRLCVSFTRTNGNGYGTRCTPFMDSIKHFFIFGKAQ